MGDKAILTFSKQKEIFSDDASIFKCPMGLCFGSYISSISTIYRISSASSISRLLGIYNIFSIPSISIISRAYGAVLGSICSLCDLLLLSCPALHILAFARLSETARLASFVTEGGIFSNIY